MVLPPGTDEPGWFSVVADIDARTAFLDDDVMKSLDLSSYSHARYEESLKKTPHLPDETAEEYRRREIAYLNIKWFMQTLLDRMDRTSMYSGLERESPLLTTVSSTSVQCSMENKIQNGGEKARSVMPSAIFCRRTIAPQKKSLPENLPSGL